MFTGIIERTLRIQAVADGPAFRRLTLPNSWPDVKDGESIAINGVCLTVAELSSTEIGFDVITETLRKTNLGLLKAGDAVNIERSLKVGDRIDGHFVQGHIDGTAQLMDVSPSAGETRLTVEAPMDLAKFLVPKGSITIDGVSLTLAALAGHRFEVALIPTTLNLTTLNDKTPGWVFNLEADIFSKTIVSYLERNRS